jgi:gluconate 2-dehydrogenase gamma chain
MDHEDHSSAADQSVALMYFNDFEACTIEAIAERIIPGDGSGAGATQAGVVYYIDRAVSGFSTGLQRVYRLGLRELDALCTRRSSASFVDLNAEQQDEIIRRFLGPESGQATAAHKDVGEDDYDFDRTAEHQDRSVERPKALEQSGAADAPNASVQDTGRRKADVALLQRFFAVIREHTMEGFFCDPLYGGNRGAVGWRLVGFPGVQWGYTAEQMKPGFDATTIPIKTLSDLRRELKSLPNNDIFTRNGRV